MLGLVQRAAVKLDDHVGDELAIGEGIETCLAARMLGIQPTWALGSVGMIRPFSAVVGHAHAASDRRGRHGERERRFPVWRALATRRRRVRVIKPALAAKTSTIPWERTSMMEWRGNWGEEEFAASQTESGSGAERLERRRGH